MSDNKLFGTIHTPPRSYYEPIDTPTIDITVGPDRTIKADLTPAVQEAITVNRSKLLILEGLLDQTINDLNALHAKHIDEVNTLLSTINEGDALLRAQLQDNYDKVNNRISYEINKLGTDITELLTTKVAYLENEIKTLSENTSDAIAQLKQNLDDEANRLDVRIDDLIAVNDTQHAELLATIDAETQRATAAEDSIRTDVNTFIEETYTKAVAEFTKALSDEQAAREQAIEAEAASRLAADEAINVTIDEFKATYSQSMSDLADKDAELSASIEALSTNTATEIDKLYQADVEINASIRQLAADVRAADAALIDTTVSLAAAISLETISREEADQELHEIIAAKAPTITGTKADMDNNTTAINGTLFVIIDTSDLDNHLTQYVRVVPQDEPEKATWLPIGVTGDVVKYVGCGSRADMFDSNPDIGGIFIVTDHMPIEEYIYIESAPGKFSWKRIGSVDILQTSINEINSKIAVIQSYNLIDPNSLVEIPADEEE